VLIKDDVSSVAEAKPTKSRFFLRNVVGLFEDLQRSDMPSSEIEKIKKSVGPMLYVSLLPPPLSQNHY
jgi:hypothetical protein